MIMSQFLKQIITKFIKNFIILNLINKLMGNQILSECQNGPGQKQKDIDPSTIAFKRNIFQHQRTNKNNNTFQSNFNNVFPQRSKRIDEIYERLKKQRKIIYSIQNEQLSISFGFKSLKQYFSKEKNVHIMDFSGQDKMIRGLNNFWQYKSDDKKTQNSPQSSEFTQMSNDKRGQLQLKMIVFNLKKLNDQHDLHLSESQLYSSKSRSLSLSFDSINVQNCISPMNEQRLKINSENLSIFDKQYTYIGFLNDKGRPHGPGQLFYYQGRQNKTQRSMGIQINSQNNQIFIEAEFSDGFISSSDCVIIFYEGHYYRGGFSRNHFNQKGNFRLYNGLQLHGHFSQGLLDGRGKASYPDRGHYEGNFKQGLKQGKGKMTWKSQSYLKSSSNLSLQISYEGYFNNDKMNGLGYLRTPNYEYWGPFIDNMKEGKGTIKFKDGKKFEGWFQKDQISGYGELHHPDGKVQKGVFPLTKQ